jgi:hypothetical protein
MKMRRLTRQRKLKARLAKRRAERGKTAASAKPTTKKKAAPAKK